MNIVNWQLKRRPTHTFLVGGDSVFDAGEHLSVELRTGCCSKGRPSKAIRVWLREQGGTATIPGRLEQIAHRRVFS